MRFFNTIAVAVLAFASAAAYASSPAELVTAGRTDDAVRELRSQLGRNPNDAAAYNLLCRAYYHAEDFGAAVGNCERAVQLQPGNSFYLMWLGRAYGSRADKAGALSAYGLARKSLDAMNRAFAADPKNMDARRDLAEYLTNAPGVVGGDRDRALRLASEIEKTDPASAAWIRALVAGARDNDAEAERQHRLAIQASRNEPAKLLELAHFYRKHKRWDDMERTISTAVSSHGVRPWDLYDAGELYLTSGRNLNGAISLLRRYLAGPADEAAPVFRIHWMLGQLLERTGDRAAAAAEYRAALALSSNYRPAKDALRKLGGAA